MTTWIVSHDRPIDSWGIDSVHSSRAAAKHAIVRHFKGEGFKKRMLTKVSVSKAITCYKGVGMADGFYYYITRRTLRK